MKDLYKNVMHPTEIFIHFLIFIQQVPFCACPNQNLKSTHVIYNSHILPSLPSYQLPHQTPFYFYSFHFLGRLWRTIFVCSDRTPEVGTQILNLHTLPSVVVQNIYLKIKHEISIIWIYISTHSNPSHFACCSVWCYHHA